MDFVALPENVVEAIVSFVIEFRKKIGPQYVNNLLREDVISILEEESIVVYYPLKDEENNAFLASGYNVLGVQKDFVFINTAKHHEKQIFAAAHELGHIKKLDEYVRNACPNFDPNTEGNEEHIMNRFAAELLMPQKHFKTLLHDGIREKQGGENGALSFADLIDIITFLMQEFFVPYKAVVYRLFELGVIKEESAQFLVQDDTDQGEVIGNFYMGRIKSNGFDKLLKPTNKKWINDLPKLLLAAAERQSVSKAVIDKMLEAFEIEPTPADMAGMAEKVEISEDKDNAGNDEKDSGC